MSVPSESSVLVLDDDHDTVDWLAAVLRGRQYEVICAHSSAQALDSLDSSGPVQLIISDVRMPGLDGFDFFRVVKQRFPNIRVVLMTGYPIVEDDIVPRGATILKKPFDVEGLFRAIAQPI